MLLKYHRELVTVVNLNILFFDPTFCMLKEKQFFPLN